MQARLTTVRGSTNPPTYEFGSTERITLGRGPENTIVVCDHFASRKHAQLFFDEGHWLIIDLGGKNGTRVDGLTVTEPSRLVDGQDICIAETCFRFNVVAEMPTPDPEPTAMVDWVEPATTWHVDELALFHDFMNQPVREANGADLIRRALEVVRKQTGASLCGYLSLDSTRPLPRLVEPANAQVNAELSKQLTRRVTKEGRRIWLMEARDRFDDSDSLSPFNDAVCVPLYARDSPLLDKGAPLGALHVYKTARFFTQREVRFCEVVAGFTASQLALLRQCRTLAAENTRLRTRTGTGDPLIGDSAAMQQLRQQIGRVASCPSTVLIRGETGSGKELVAQALHERSDREHGPFVVVNCGAISPNLLESELFGHKKGAFSGAIGSHQGYFLQADNGTLFLDEIGDMPLDCQVKLLRAIEGKSFQVVGGDCPVQPDVRIVAASHKDLAQEVKAGRFRQDLFFRLNVIVLTVPPLRERLDDLATLAQHFVCKFSRQFGKTKQLSAAALQRLREHAWPGNVRELRAVIESAVVMSEDESIAPHELRLQGDLSPELPSLNLEHLEAWAIRRALRQTGGNVSAAARVLGVARDTFNQKMKKYDIDRDECND